MQDKTPEARVILAIEAIQSSCKLSRRAAAKIYNVPEATLRHRMNGRTTMAERRPAVQNLSKIEEEVVVRYILDLDSRGFPPSIGDVAAMANHVLASRGAQRVGKQWTYRFIQRREELKTRFSRAYDFQRALCENPDVINAWFQLVFNMRAKYGILDCDFYNFDETGFMMGMICPGMVVTRSDRRGKGKAVQPGNREWATAITCVSGDGWDLPPFLLVQGLFHLASWYTEGGIPDSWVIKPTSNGWTDNETGLDWIKHFDKHTKVRTKGAYRMLVLDGHESHQSVDFEAYCKDHNIIPICLPPHSSHITQPLDVGFFSVLKRAYGREINMFIRAHINNITKVEFFLAFYAAYMQSMTVSNVLGGFRGAGLIPFDPQAVISKLDVKLRTPTPTGPPEGNADPWVSQTPHNPTETLSQTTLVKTRIRGHQGSSPTPIFQMVDHLTKGVEKMAHEMTLLKAEAHNLRKANEALSKRRRAKRTRVRQGGPLTGEDARDILAQKEVNEQVAQDMRENRGGDRERPANVRRCGNCGKPGHNARTCQVEVEMSDVYNSE
jgi:hypothetical protein